MRDLSILACSTSDFPALLASFASSLDADERAQAARCEVLSATDVERLAADPDWYVRVQIAERAGLAPKLRATLATDAVPAVRNAALQAALGA